MEKKNMPYEKPILENLDEVGKGIQVGKCDSGSGAIGQCLAGAGVKTPLD